MGQAFIPMLACVVELLVRSYAAVVLADLMGYKGIFYANPIAWVGAASVVAIGYWFTIRGLKRKLGTVNLKFASLRVENGQDAPQTLSAE